MSGASFLLIPFSLPAVLLDIPLFIGTMSHPFDKI
jgi:hypothetical protein